MSENSLPVIRRLPAEVIGQIAAGEVVERPASAVKELVENSIDAGAKSITVELRDGGISYLRVSDNGRGIPAGQIRVAFERHATSKLRTAEELYQIRSLGFRGEALASIAAVAKVTCLSRTPNEDYGTRLIVDSGIFGEVTQAASPVGTSITVENLFKNAPVRLKFLKKPSIEAGMVADYMSRLILSHPEIAFRFVNNEKTIYRSIGDGKISSAIYALYGAELYRKMIPIHKTESGIILNGHVGVDDAVYGNRQQQSFFVNLRYFRSETLSRALESGCAGRVMTGRYPMCILFLEMPYNQVDVNVHPNKLEVRFQNEGAVAELVETAVSEALHKQTLSDAILKGRGTVPVPKFEGTVQIETAPPVPDAPPVIKTSLPAAAAGEDHQTAAEKSTPQQNDSAVSELPVPSPILVRRPEPPMAVHELTEIPKTVVVLDPVQQTEKPAEDQQSLLPDQSSEAPLPRLIGIAFDTYWIFEHGDRLLCLDQHAAHERLLYDRYLKLYQESRFSQQLLSPVLVQMTAADLAIVKEYNDLLLAAGFEAEVFDSSHAALRAVPMSFDVSRESPAVLLAEAIGELRAGHNDLNTERIRSRIASMACKHAIKGGDALTEAQTEVFLREFIRSGSMPTCPHGRPIVVEMTRQALEKKFKRIV